MFQFRERLKYENLKQRYKNTKQVLAEDTNEDNKSIQTAMN